MTVAIQLYPANSTAVAVGGTSTVALYGPLIAGRITNPPTAADQGVAVAEDLFVSIVGPAGLSASATTYALAPGQSFKVPNGTATNVSVNAATSGHRFSAFGTQPFVPYVPPTGNFPPAGPTTITKTIPSYLYEQYNDDEDLQAFVDWYNATAQNYVTWFATIGLPVYAGDNGIVGSLLDWMGAGLYGYPRPSLPSGTNQNLGPLNTYAPNVLSPNQVKIIGNQNVYATTDDIYKRCLTWQLWRGDGRYFTIKWLKRRIVRFLTGENGGPGQTDDTSMVSVTFGPDNEVNIVIGPGTVAIAGGAIPNMAWPNGFAPNQVDINFTPGPYIPDAVILKAAIDAGAIDLPFQYTYVVTVG